MNPRLKAQVGFEPTLPNCVSEQYANRFAFGVTLFTDEPTLLYMVGIICS
jgi:hypothetical protein